MGFTDSFICTMHFNGETMIQTGVVVYLSNEADYDKIISKMRQYPIQPGFRRSLFSAGPPQSDPRRIGFRFEDFTPPCKTD
jgi:GTP cyclohydrolase II